MKLSFITDEVTQDFEEAVAFAKEQGAEAVELRSVQDTPIDRIAPDTLRAWKKRLDEVGLVVCNLASSFYKCRIEEAGEEMDKLRRLCDAADILGCGTIRGFAFLASENGPAFDGSGTENSAALKIKTLFSEPAALLRKRGKRLLLEADPGVNTTNHHALASLLAALQMPEIGAIYDPGNDIYDPFGEIPYPDGYKAVRPYLSHVHIKDAVLDEEGKPMCVRVGTGRVDYPALLKALTQDGYEGYLSMETHYRVQNKLTEEQMLHPQGSGFSQGGREATAESMEALKKMLCQAAR